MLPLLAGLSLVALSIGDDQDVVLTRKTHTDAMQMGEREVPARDSTQTIWIHGKDRLRIEDGDRVTIVRLDEKKMHILNTKEKTVTTVDLPFDLAKAMAESGQPAPGGPGGGRAGRGEGPGSRPAPVVTPTDETKKVKEWTARKYTLTRSGAMDAGTDVIWASKDLGIDVAAFHEMVAHTQSLRPGAAMGPEALKKIDGIPVLIERVRAMRDQEVKSTEEIVSVEKKAAPAGAFEAPAGFEKRPFDPRAMMGGGRGMRGEGGPGSRPGRGPRGGAESQPAPPKKEVE